MKNITFKNLGDNLVLLTFYMGDIRVRYSAVASVNPVWISIFDDSILPYSPEIHRIYRAWSHNQKYASLLEPYKKGLK